MIPRRKICVVTGTRADYGLLYWTLQEIEADDALDLALVVTGSHLGAAFGNTQERIEQDGFTIAARVDLELGDDSEVGVARAMGRGVIGFADALDRLAPDLLVVLGDRYEILAAASAALLLRIPVAHVHGGENTEGQIDEAVRHAVTKMSHLHCVAAEPYARRVAQLGEQPASIHVVGVTAFDHLERGEFLDRAALEASIGHELGDPIFVVTLHPETLSSRSPAEQAAALVDALAAFPDACVIATGSNADPAGRRLTELIRDAVTSRPGGSFHESLGQVRYLSLLALADVMIGNSSSGIIEGPALGIPAVNIGDRQRSRLRAPAVIDCAADAGAIRRAIETALTPAHRELAARRETPYGVPGAARRIVRLLRETPLDGILVKRFHDLVPDGAA